MLTRRGQLGKGHANARGRQPVAALPLEGEPAQPCPLCGDTGRNVTPTGKETACQCLRGKPTVDRDEAPFYRFLREGIVYAVRERVINLGCPDDGDGWGTMYGASTRERAHEVAEVYRGRFGPQNVEVLGMTRSCFDAINAACPDQGPGAIDRPLVDGEGG